MNTRGQANSAASTGTSESSTATGKRVGKHFRHFIRTSLPTLLGALLVIVILIGSIFAPLFVSADPNKQNIRQRLRPPAWMDKGSLDHPLGTDQVGRDLFARILYGGRVCLLVGFSAVIISGTLGVAIGLVAGYFGGRLDSFIMRTADVQLGFPIILLAILLVAILGPGLVNLIIVLAIGSWVVYARTTRVMVLSLKEMEFVTAAKAIGSSDLHIMLSYILPNLLNPIIVIATLQIGQMILLESALSFLGLGVQPPTPSWGVMIADARNYIYRAWWLVSFPGLTLALLVLGSNLLGDGLRDWLEGGYAGGEERKR